MSQFSYAWFQSSIGRRFWLYGNGNWFHSDEHLVHCPREKYTVVKKNNSKASSTWDECYIKLHCSDVGIINRPSYKLHFTKLATESVHWFFFALNDEEKTKTKIVQVKDRVTSRESELAVTRAEWKLHKIVYTSKMFVYFARCAELVTSFVGGFYVQHAVFMCVCLYAEFVTSK